MFLSKFARLKQKNKVLFKRAIKNQGNAEDAHEEVMSPDTPDV